MRGREVDALAAKVAHEVHACQYDKVGEPYIGHPTRVAAAARARAPEARADLAVASAWLHDVVEDTNMILDDLAELGFPERIVAAVDALTRRPAERPDTYYARVAADPIVFVVKLADLADNSDPERLARLDPNTRDRLTAKYSHARDRLAQLRPNSS